MYIMMGFGHVIDLTRTKNRSALNAGVTLYFDLLFPLVMVARLILWKLGY